MSRLSRHATFAVVPALVFLLPAALAGGAHLAHPTPWVAFALGVLTLASQPPLTPTALVSDASDRQSALLILLAVVAANLASSMQFSWRAVVAPAATSGWTIGGLGVAVAGMALRLWAIRVLGRFFTSSVMVQEGQRVLTGGPYRWMRHPSYTGSILTVAGTALAFGSGLGLACAVALVIPAYLYRIHVEERTLLAGLGEPYAAYRRRTPALVPGRRPPAPS